MPRSRRPNVLLSLFAAVLVTGCAGGVRPVSVSPQALAALEADRLQHPHDPDVLTRLGIAYYQAGRPDLARDVLETVLVLEPGAFSAAVHLGLAQEQLGDLAAARRAYASAGGMRVTRGQRAEVEKRLAVLGRLEMAADARRALAAERSLALAPPVANTVAVLPFRYLGEDDDLRPLGRGLTHLVVSDLAKVARLTVLERERVQALLDELALNGSGAVDPATAARSGRLLGAERVVHGVLREVGTSGSVAVEAQVMETGAGVVTASGAAADRLQRLLDMQKALVFDLLDQMGIVPTPAERRAIGERPTADLQAFLAFSRGLEAADRGDLAAARRHFDAAAGRDAGFSAARERVAEVHRLSLAARTTPERLSVTARPPGSADEGIVRTRRADFLGAAVSSVAPSTGDKLDRRAAERRRAGDRARVQEGLNRDDPTLIGLTGTIVIVVPRP
jgi:TolB-like protein